MSLPAIPIALRSVVVPSVDGGSGTLLTFPPKDPNETVDYGIDATALFAATGDTFAQVEVSVTPNDMTVGLTRWDSTHATFRLSGGTKFTTYSINITAILVSGESPCWNGSLMCGAGSLPLQASPNALFSINGFALIYAGASLTIGSST